MIIGLAHVGEDHECSICSSCYTEEDGGIIGYFGILPVAFCPDCYVSVLDMADTYTDPTCDRYLNSEGLLSRMDGPAVEWSDDEVEYWVDGVKLSEDEYNLLIFLKPA